MNPLSLSRADFEKARERVSGLAIRTPLIRLDTGQRDDIYLKLENLQPIGSFKIRSAANALVRRRDYGRVFTASAGNFAQGLAYVGRALDIPVLTYVPDTAARSKVDALKRLGAEIVTVAYDQWWDMLAHRSEDPAFIHPATDPDVIAGNGTIGLEILEDLPDVRSVLAPYGGGGLSVGIGAALQAAGSAAQVIACETEAGAPVRAALAAGRPVEIAFDSTTFVTGMGAPVVLDTMWPNVQAYIAGTALVSLQETAEAIRTLADRHHVIAEGAGSATVAAALNQKEGGPIVCIVSGGHLDNAHLVNILQGKMP